MKLICTITKDASETSPLAVRVTVCSHLTRFVMADMLEGDVETGDLPEGVLLGSLSYPLPGRVPLPPIQLVERCDDLEEAEAWYAQYDGYRYIGRVLLPTLHLGERIEVFIQREALLCWQQLLPTSHVHQEARRIQQVQQQKLFCFLPHASAGEDPSQQEALRQACELLSRPDTREESLRVLQPIAQETPSQLPLPALFSCLNATEDAQVLRDALQLMKGLAKILPADRLYTISTEAAFSARLAAITLLGWQGGNKAFGNLLCINVLGNSRRERGSERIAILQALADGMFQGLEHPVDALDGLDILRDAATSDPLPRVRAEAERMLIRMAFPLETWRQK